MMGEWVVTVCIASLAIFAVAEFICMVFYGYAIHKRYKR